MTPMKLFAVSMGNLALITFVDAVTGFELMLYVFYVIPVALCAWHSGLGTILGMSFLCGVFWWCADPSICAGC
jgi:hypothetical protein